MCPALCKLLSSKVRQGQLIPALGSSVKTVRPLALVLQSLIPMDSLLNMLS